MFTGSDATRLNSKPGISSDDKPVKVNGKDPTESIEPKGESLDESRTHPDNP